MTQTIRVVANVVAFTNQIESLKEVLLELVQATRQEAGCIQYDLCQSIDNPASFTFVEEWETEEALKAHLGGDNLDRALKKVEGMVAVGPDIRLYQQIA